MIKNTSRNYKEIDFRSPGSALLLTVMIIAILTTTTLASIAVRFDQLASTDKLASAAVAKSAADSALVKLKEKLASSQTVTPTTLDLDNNQESTLSTTTPFRPNPRKIVSTYQKATTTLPRCLAVAVLVPWTNDGQYLMSQQNGSNPALIFNYANIVNDTPLGMIPGNGGLSATDKQTTVSQLTNMGHFYNPYAPAGSYQSNVNYWTVNLGGPQDQFLTRNASDGVGSYYKNLDFVYLPYLPRFQDSGLFTTTPGTGVDRVTGAQLETKFESVIKTNNFKVWIDAAVTDSDLGQYGFGDLFTSDSNYRLKWLQPSLWNDDPEADMIAPYRADDADAATLSWDKKALPKMTPGANDSGWNTSIIKGSKSFSFIKLSSAQSATAFSPGASITGLIYGSLEGIRLNQTITLVALSKSSQPLPLTSRAQDQGRFYNVKFTKIGPTSTSNGVDAINVTFQLSSDAYETPQLAIQPTSRAATWADMDTIAVLAGPQFSTNKSNQGVTITADADGVDATVNIGSNCIPTGGVLTACPAVGDIVDLTKSGNTPVWGKVTKANYDGTGTTLTSMVLDQLHKSPPPIREMASTYFTSGGSPRIAYYGGAIDMNDYEGGYASESNQLWIYDPENDAWTFPFTNSAATNPGQRAGSSMVYDPVNNRLVLVGGYYHEAVVASPNTANCELVEIGCLYTNRPGLRIAKRVTNDVYAYNIAGNSWEKMDYSAGWGKIQNNVTYRARVTSTLADRSGLERWNLNVKNPYGTNVTVNLDGTPSNLTVFPTAAGVAPGDQIYLNGNKASNGSESYAWGKINSVDYNSNSINVTAYAGGEGAVTFSALQMNILQRTKVTNDCVGSVVGSMYSCLFNSGAAGTTGYAVGDSVVLEQYSAGDAQLSQTLSGYISFIDSSGRAYFVADERLASLKDFSDRTVGQVSGDSAVAFPSGRYGATMASLPTDTTKASYWEGAATNITYDYRFADLWKAQFNAGSGPNSVVWSFQTTDNPVDTASLNSKSGSYNLQVMRPQYNYQIETSSSTSNNPEVIKTTVTDPKTGQPTIAWDDNQHWLLQISAGDANKVVTGSWATIERRLADGSREVFHGIVDNMYTGQPSQCGSYDDTKLCLRHNPAFSGDSGLTSNSANSSVSMSPYFNPSVLLSGNFRGDTTNGVVTMKNVGAGDYGSVPAQGAIVLIWNKSGTFPADAYTFVVNDRTYNAGSGTFSFRFDKLTASPHSYTYSSSQIASSGGTDRLMTITDQNSNTDYAGGPEWTKDVSTGAWKLRLAAKYSNYLARPSQRQGGALASVYDSSSTSSKIYMVGGTHGQFGTLWREQNAGSTTTGGASWDPKFVSADGNHDVPNLSGGSLIVYKQGSSTRAIYFGGKFKTDFSSNDYDDFFGPNTRGRPDNFGMTTSDNQFFISGHSESSGTDAAAFVNTIKNNLPANRPSGVDKSLEFHANDSGGPVPGQTVCVYLGQSSGCSSEQLLSNLGELGRFSSTNSGSGGWTWGRTSLLTDVGTAFKQQTVGGTVEPSLIMSAPTQTGAFVNGWNSVDGYRPYLKDDSGANAVPYGKLSTDFGSNKTGVVAAYSTISGGGSILITPVSVGTAIANSRGGSTGTIGGWYSYCPASAVKKDVNGNIDLNNDGTYKCASDATRYMSWLPDSEDMLFLMNAGVALASTDTYKVTGYYGGIKRGYLVVSRSGSQPTVYEVAP